MQSITKTIVVTTALSTLVHGAVFAVVLFVPQSPVTLAEGATKGLDIQLISASLNSDELHTDVPNRDMPNKLQTAQKSSPENLSFEKPDSSLHKSSQSVVSSLPVEQVNTVIEPDDNTVTVLQNVSTEESVVLSEAESSAQLLRSDNVSLQPDLILELLHSRISSNKEYPYIAKRQRREGVVTIAFVLHPDGKIENAHLINSSRTLALDRAALSAVKQIEPFNAAQDYLRQSKRFQVDVAFSLL